MPLVGRPRASDIDTATTERILAAAEAEFARAGYDRARLEDIARAAGISRPSLLYHFGSKADLYAAVVRGAFTKLWAALAGAMGSDRSFAVRLEATIGVYMDTLDEHPALAALFLRELLDGRGPGHRLLLTELVPLLDRVEQFVRSAGKGVVREDLPVRAAILQAAMAALVRSAAGPLRAPLWGDVDRTRALARVLFLGR